MWGGAPEAGVRSAAGRSSGDGGEVGPGGARAAGVRPGVEELRQREGGRAWRSSDDDGRFEMSMMGELKYFLRFEIKQMRQGTFINQAKYLQDMLKRFDMKGAIGIGTPMHLKCQHHVECCKDKMINLYIAGRAVCGSAYDLLPTYDIMNQIFRNTINPKKSNQDEVHGFLVNLLVLTQQNQGSGKQLDCMDYIWHEMRDCAFLCKLCAFAPYIIRLICIKWDQSKRGDLLTQCGHITTHLVCSPIVKNKLRFGPNAPKDKEDEEADSDDSDYMPQSVKTKTWFAKLTTRLKKSFCFKEDRMYYEHEQNKKIRQRQKAMMVHMGLTVSDGSENIITPPEEWKSKHKWTSSENCIPERNWNRPSPPHGQGQDEEDEEDEDEGDGDEEDNEDEDEDDKNEDDEDEDDE
ncbi:hypothetical protein QYE76_052840 [Lolium multiflorum]|uniref:Reverse transcriptase Ty1/copia-type domain-containing protein n=1 Tax=Lolium multiflorum TaxID=4521 RepID=A0AAD8SUN5_LOLMU|nr:hypothetical protein QYE76_052840 [Lolium multiflorum]